MNNRLNQFKSRERKPKKDINIVSIISKINNQVETNYILEDHRDQKLYTLTDAFFNYQTKEETKIKILNIFVNLTFHGTTKLVNDGQLLSIINSCLQQETNEELHDSAIMCLLNCYENDPKNNHINTFSPLCHYFTRCYNSHILSNILHSFMLIIPYLTPQNNNILEALIVKSLPQISHLQSTSLLLKKIKN